MEALAIYRTPRQLRDREDKDTLIFTHIDQRQSLQARHERLTGFAKNRNKLIKGDIEQYRDIGEHKRDVFERYVDRPKIGESSLREVRKVVIQQSLIYPHKL